MTTTAEDIETWIKQGFPDATITVEGDGHHFHAIIISSAFTGKSLLQRQRLVYSVLGDKMQNEIHALSMKTLTPKESGN